MAMKRSNSEYTIEQDLGGKDLSSGSRISRTSHGEDRPRSRSDSDIMVSEYSKIPLALRAQVEAWDLDRTEIVMDETLGSESSTLTGSVMRKCRWRGLDCVAKMLFSQNPLGMQDMLEELSLISHLRHPNLVLFLGACTTGEPLIILNEYLPCGNLETYMREQKSIHRKVLATSKMKKAHSWKPPPKLAHRWCMDLARALSFLHSCPTPVIHRDLKPSNLLLQDDMHLKVSDFGLCKTLHRDDLDGVPLSTGSQEDCWKAPEILRGDPTYDHTSDIYSMGMIFWFICTGEKPYANESQNPNFVADVAHALQIKPDLKLIEQEYGKEMCNVIEQCWMSEPALRLSAETAVDFLEALKVQGAAKGGKSQKGACCIS